MRVWARVVQQYRNSKRGFLQLHAPIWLKRRQWNQDYATGHWACLENNPIDIVYPFIERYARKGSILDLGCGPGTVGCALDPALYTSYLGADISEVAIARAKERDARGQNRYLVSEIFSYRPTESHDVIFWGDCIYYFSPKRATEMMQRYTGYLKPGGVLIVRMCVLTNRERAILAQIENHFTVVEKKLEVHEQGWPLAVIVFRRKGQ